LQVVRQRQNRGRHARIVGHRLVQHRQLVRARIPGLRVIQPKRREQRERGTHPSGRIVYCRAGDCGPVVLDTEFLLYTENVSGRRHYHSGSVHGRSAGGQADLPFEKE